MTNHKSVLDELFNIKKPIIGNIHCLPLPGAPFFERNGFQKAVSQAKDEALMMQDCGLDGVIIENAGDAPYVRPENIGFETVSALTTIATEISKAISIPFGILCLGNGAIPSIAIAAATGASFIRVNLWAHSYVGIEGIMNGPAPEALRYRSFIKAEHIKIIADVHVKFGAHIITADRPIHELATDIENCGAQVLVATGQRTGDPTKLDEVIKIKKGTTKEVIIGSGLNPNNCEELFSVADGAIVGAYLKEDGRWQNKLSISRMNSLMKVVKQIRNTL
ncbi:MAG TPA: BtpA/SgcQ family protein [Brevefilum sp.]|nr:BtpA/SgcQ family protein [Brevefilum sp.]HOR18814.1 BtpA/SgcQ family protein [Brevefilum sp.]HPL68714.1 BtpA/SgcQ family protein [Brevefilum sp.]